jgi:hypothetical protein
VRKPLVAIAAVSLVAGLLAGCGDSSSSSTSSVTVQQQAAPLSKAQFISKGDEICEQVRAEQKALIKSLKTGVTAGSRPGKVHEVAELVKDLGEAATAEIEGLRKLPPPSAYRKTIDRMLDLAESQGTFARKARHIAQGYGFKVCGSKVGEIQIIH